MPLTPSPRALRAMAQSIRNYSAPTSDTIPAAKQKLIPSTAHLPAGFLFGTVHAGIKPSNKTTPDVAVVHSTIPCTAAAVFTQNRFQAAPVTVSREILQSRKGQGIKGLVVNSGCANAVTGTGGLEDARAMGRELDRALNQQEGGTGSTGESESGSAPGCLVMSTGVIGQPLPMARLIPGISAAAAATGSTYDAFHGVTRAICTTDTFPKLSSRTFTLPSFPGSKFSIAGTSKGAGMIHPNMATLLGFMLTDAPVSPAVLDHVLRTAVDRSFNCISIDGDTSTNDTVALLANGAGAKASPLYKGAPPVITDVNSEDAAALAEAVRETAGELARLVVRDGEGATKFVTLRVTGAPDFHTGRRVASSVARSPLVKTALYGKDANWGRILCAVGYTDGIADGAIDPAKVSVSFVDEKSGEELQLLMDGQPVQGGVDEAKAAKMLQEEDLMIDINLQGKGGNSGEEVRFWTCDFSHEYVTINGDYRT